MDQPVEFTAYVRPACLNPNEELDNKKAIATGFGKLEYGNYSFNMSLTYNCNKIRRCENGK